MFIYIGLAGAYLGGWYIFWRLKIKHPHKRILAFHDVSDNFDLSITRTGTRRFRDIIEYIMKSGFHGKNISSCRMENDLALTFDDGWESFYINAFPVLQQYGFSATVFIITGYVGRSSRWDYHMKKHLNWMQICELAEKGIEFACHSNSHVDLRKLDKKRLEYEIVDSKKTIEDKIGQPVKYFSYPFGRYNENVIEAVKKAGYEKAFCLKDGAKNFAIPRLGVYLYDTPYSMNLKLAKNSCIEGCKDYVNNALAGGTMVLRTLLPVSKKDMNQ